MQFCVKVIAGAKAVTPAGYLNRYEVYQYEINYPITDNTSAQLHSTAG